MLQIVSGDHQNGGAGQLLAQPFTVVVKDAFGVLLSNAPVVFSIVQGGGSFAPSAFARTDSSGQARATLRLAASPLGSSLIRATAGVGTHAATVDFTATLVSPPAAPASVTVTKNTDGSYDLTWGDRSDNEDGFAIELWNSVTHEYEVIGTAPANRTSAHVNPDRTLAP